MRKIYAALFIVFFAAGCASAGIMDMLGGGNKIEYSTKSAIPMAKPIEYRGLKLSGESAQIILINRSDDKTYKFNANCAFLDARGNELGDFFVPEVTLQPKQQLPMKNLYFKGNTKIAKANAKTLNWTIYKLEEVK